MPQIHVLAIASGGGHWEQLMLLRPAFDNAAVSYVSTSKAHAEHAGIANCILMQDCNQDEPRKLAAGLLQSLRIVRKTKPDVAISTGAAPGLLCLFWARIHGARTIWVDSIANAEKLSLSGRIALRFCTIVITQWRHLANGDRPRYMGSIL